jgi:O-antigen ligase
MNMQARAVRGGQPIVQADDKRFSLLIAVTVFLMFFLVIMPGGGMEILAPEDTSDHPATRVLWLMFLAIGTTIVFVRLAAAKRLWRELNVFYRIFVFLVLASVTWSIDSEVTFTRIVRLLTMLSVFIAIAVAAWNPRRFQQLARPIVTLILLGSIVAGLAVPELAIHQEPSPELLHAWKGLTGQKNILGSLASFGFVLWLHGLLSKQVKLPVALFGGAVSATCLVLSRSSTSLMATVFSSLFLLLLMRTPGSMRRSMPYLAGMLTTAILVYAMAILRVVPGLEILLSPIPMITGKDLTFSGRAQIWAAVVEHIQMRPLLGSGYGAYWVGPTPGTESYRLIQILFGFYPYSAHNGYLDVLNDLGFVGLACLGGYLIVYVRHSLRLYAVDRAQGALYLALFLLQAITNLSEALWLSVTTFDFVLMSIATTCLARAMVEARAQPRFGAKVPPSGRQAMQRVNVPRPVGNRSVRPANSPGRRMPYR